MAKPSNGKPGLKDRHAELVKEDESILAAARAENRNLTRDESNRREQIRTEVDALAKS